MKFDIGLIVFGCNIWKVLRASNGAKELFLGVALCLLLAWAASEWAMMILDDFKEWWRE